MISYPSSLGIGSSPSFGGLEKMMPSLVTAIHCPPIRSFAPFSCAAKRASPTWPVTPPDLLRS